MAKKKKKVEIVEEVKEEVKKLSEIEMDKIDHFNKDVTILTKDIECYDLKVQLLEKEITLLRSSKLEQVNKFKDKKRKYDEFLNELKEKYEIDGSFSYHPETGEIVK